MILDFLLLPVLFFVGSLVSLSDWQIGKIKNKWLLAGFLWGVGVLLLFLVWFFISDWVVRHFDFLTSDRTAEWTILPQYIGWHFLNALLALIIGFLLWRVRAWAAGDAKVFFIFALLIPLWHYQGAYLPLFPSFVLLINTFIPVLVYLLVRSIFFSLGSWDNKKSKEPKEKQFKNIRSMGRSILVITTIILIINTFGLFIQRYLIEPIYLQSIIFAIIIIFSKRFSEFNQKKSVLVTVTLVLIGLLIYVLTISFWGGLMVISRTVLNLLIFMTALFLLRQIVGAYLQKTGMQRINISQLKAGMLPDRDFLYPLKKQKDLKLGHVRPEGLTKRQTKIIKRWFLGKKRQVIQIYQPFSFVPWIFLGVLITLLINTSLLSLFLDLLGRG